MIMETFGQRIRKRRKELGLSQEKLAERVGMTKNSIQNLERDLVKYPNPITLCKLASALQVSLYYVLPDELLETLSENPADLAFRELCQDLYSKERIDSIKTIIAALSAFHPQK